MKRSMRIRNSGLVGITVIAVLVYVLLMAGCATTVEEK